jgi:hypothetical protein
VSTMLFDQDFMAGTTKLWHEDADGTVRIETVQDLEPLWDDNTRLQRERGKAFHKDSGRQNLVARIPLWLMFVLRKRGVLDDGPLFLDWLNRHPQYKTTEARL